MIETYKIITNKEGINSDKFFDLEDERGDPAEWAVGWTFAKS